MQNNRVNICNVEIDNVTYDDTLAFIDNAVTKRQNTYIVTPNVDHIVKLQDDLYFKEIYDNASLVLADGVPLIWASRFLNRPIKEKISGSDLFPRVCKLASEKNYKLFFMGGRPGAAEKASGVLRKQFANIDICGIYCPPFGFENDQMEMAKIGKMLKDARPDILFVGLGAPKQEKWIYENYRELKIPVSAGIGVTFEFVAGMVKRAPVFMQKIGLEWFWRLLMEPRRLWRRYLVEDMKFFYLVYRQKFQKEKASNK